MDKILEIVEVNGREILDSTGKPTVEAEMTVLDTVTREKFIAYASVPSGVSSGRFEAVELRDCESEYLGFGVQKAVRNINEKIAPILIGHNAIAQEKIDLLMINLDGTEDKHMLGANAILAVSIACARVAAIGLKLPLYRYLGGVRPRQLPIPMMTLLNRGKDVTNTVDVQEFMILPVAATGIAEGIRICTEIYHNLEIILTKNKFNTEGCNAGVAVPDLNDTEAVLNFIVEAIKISGYVPEQEIKIALDMDSSKLYREDTGMYHFPKESKVKGEEVVRDISEMIAYYEELIEKYPILLIEDGLAEDDWEGWKQLTRRLGDKIQLVGDALFVSNLKRLEAGIKMGAANCILIKINQIGTLTEVFQTVEIAHKKGYKAIISDRCGETEDTIIADIVVALNTGLIKTGAPCGTERVAKYNQLMRIEERLC